MTAKGRHDQNLPRRQQGGEVVEYKVSYAAPLPPPAMVEHYEHVLPGAADRLFASWEKQSDHRQNLETAKIQGDLAAEKRGQFLGFILSMAVIVIGGLLLWAGHDVTGLALILGDLVALVSVFVYGRRRQEKERLRRFNEMQEREQLASENR